MTGKDISKAKNPDIRASLPAMQKAADMARKIAIQTETSLVILQEGKVVLISAEQLRREKNA